MSGSRIVESMQEAIAIAQGGLCRAAPGFRGRLLRRIDIGMR